MHWALNSIQKVKEAKFEHANWTKAFVESSSMVVASSPGEVVSIVGPSRVGKSQLVLELINFLLKNFVSSKENQIPIISLLATNCSVNGSFSSKSFTLRALEATQNPFYTISDTDDFFVNQSTRLGRTPETTLRPALEKSLIHRKTQFIFIDEAQHVLYANGERSAESLLSSWKCLAQATNTVLILVGSYPLLYAIAKCPHLIGRNLQIHFPRYQYDKQDLTEFCSLLKSYDQFIKLEQGDSLKNYAKFLYDGSLGCIGLLTAWIRSSLALACSKESDYLTLEHLKNSRKSLPDREAMADEILKGEKYINTKYDVSEKPQGSASNKFAKKKKSSRRPFEKKPRRYHENDR